MTRPQPSEHAPYFSKYIDLVPAGDIAVTLAAQTAALAPFWQSITEETSLRQPPGKWNIRQVMNHLIDTERIFAYRTLRIGRGDQTPLPGFEQEDLEQNAGSTARTWSSLLEEYVAVRQSTLALFRNLPADSWACMGTSSNHALSAQAAAFAVTGHELHHVAILKQHYL